MKTVQSSHFTGNNIVQRQPALVHKSLLRVGFSVKMTGSGQALSPKPPHALSRQRRTAPSVPQGTIPSEELGRVRPSVAGAWQPDGVGHTGSDRGLAGAAHGPARTLPFLFESGH